MTVGMGILLIVIGAIIAFALNVNIGGVEEGTIGMILMIAGAVVLVLALISAPFRYLGRRRHDDAVAERRTARGY